MQQEGIDNSVDAAKRLGITTLDDNADYGLSLALGSAEVPLSEMTNAYAAFANGGERYERTSIESIENKFGNVIFSPSLKSTRALSEQGSYLISDILSDNQARSRIFGSSLNVTGTDGKTKKVAVKTGTTDDAKDAWTIGYTPDIAIGVWVGNNDNAPMRSGGADMAGPIWRAAMGKAVGASSPSFAQPAGVVKATVCVDGKRTSDVFLSTNVPNRCDDNPNKQEEQQKDEEQQQPTAPVAKCTVAGKETLNATDPNCKEEMCTISGKENLAANDPNCKADTGTNLPDSDGDGVPNTIDQCPNTPSGATVNTVGCATNQTPTTGANNRSPGTSGQ